ncbi:hypothetical protein LJC46_04130 [Desulfovibrio sp. OttesenSCG-928-G15]|nr:hypothetical protein [Desulfovibrio sp. OttesenSCG-928-G15]
MTGKEIIIQLSTWRGIHEHVEHARLKHPWAVGVSNWYKSRVLLSEVREFFWAVFWERDAVRIREEALDVIAVLIRWIEGDGR